MVLIVSQLAAGSVSDISLRVIGERLSQHLRVPVVIENQPGTGGVWIASHGEIASWVIKNKFESNPLRLLKA